MKLKKIFIACGMLAALPAMAQYEGTTVYDRIGHGEDSINTLGNIVLYKDYYKAKDYMSAYGPWKEVLEKAPCAEVSTYAYGAAIVANVLVKEADMAKKKTYFNELMNLYDTRLKNLDALNSFTKPNKRATKGDILARKAFDYAYYGAGVADNYSLDNAYEQFREAIDLINADGAKEVPGFVLDKFFEISYQKYVADNAGFREQFLQDYLESREACEKMLSLANEAEDSVEAQKIVAQYDPTLNRIETMFAQSKAADRDQLIAIFGSLNGMIIAFPRYYYDMAAEKHFFKNHASLNKYGVPQVALISQAVISCILVLLRSLDQLTSLVVFAGMLYNVLVIAAVVVYRKKFPNLERPYKAWGYPVTVVLAIVLFFALMSTRLNLSS